MGWSATCRRSARKELILTVEFNDMSRAEVVYKKAGERDFRRVLRAIDKVGGFESEPMFVMTTEHRWSKNRMDDWWVIKLTPASASDIAQLTVDAPAREITPPTPPPAPPVDDVDEDDPWAGIDAPVLAGGVGDQRAVEVEDGGRRGRPALVGSHRNPPPGSCEPGGAFGGRDGKHSQMGRDGQHADVSRRGASADGRAGRARERVLWRL